MVNLGLENMLATMKTLAQNSPSGATALAAASKQVSNSSRWVLYMSELYMSSLM